MHPGGGNRSKDATLPDHFPQAHRIKEFREFHSHAANFVRVMGIGTCSDGEIMLTGKCQRFIIRGCFENAGIACLDRIDVGNQLLQDIRRPTASYVIHRMRNADERILCS